MAWVEQLTIGDLRNIHEATLGLHPGLNIFVGRNAQGKTSLLEAVGIVSRGRSFRTHDAPKKPYFLVLGYIAPHFPLIVPEEYWKPYEGKVPMPTPTTWPRRAFLRAYRSFGGLAPDANVRAWLFAIATNLARNHFRGEQRRRTAYAMVMASRDGRDGDGPEAETLYREARSTLEAVVDGLPLKQRLAFTLRKVHDLGYDESPGRHSCIPGSTVLFHCRNQACRSAGKQGYQ